MINNRVLFTVFVARVFRFTLILVIVLGNGIVKAQDQIDFGRFLDKQPYFALNNAKSTDSLFKQDLKILNHYLQLDSIDAELLKPSILGALMIEQSRAGKAATFSTLINYLKDFKTTIAYQDFRKGIILYRSMESRQVNLDNWDNDKQLFVRLGFTENDLADFKIYLLERAEKNSTYKQAYVGYLKEIEAL